MEQRTNLSRIVDVVDKEAQYDENVKYILAEKPILSYIVKYTISEFKDVPISEILSLIEGTPEVSSVDIEPDAVCSSVLGINTEDSVPREGKVTYDIRFIVWTPDKKVRMKLHIDIEAQKDFYPGYDIVTRGIYNVSRMISSQKNTEFMKSNYKEIKRVYSIWICMNVPKYAKNSIIRYALNEQILEGTFPENKVYYDIPHIIIICLADELVDSKSKQKLIRLLGTILSPTLEKEIKKRILEEEFNIPMTEAMDRRAMAMCNLSQGILERGIEKGIERGIEKGIENMQKLSIVLLENHKYEELERASKDIEFCRELFVKYGIV